MADRGESKMPDRLDLARLTRHIVADPTGPCNKPGLTVLVQVPETPVWVGIDREILEPLVIDLIRSAAESITMKGIVEIVLDPDRSAHEVRMLVRDTGVGFEPGAAEHVFDPPSQADCIDMRALRERIRAAGADVTASSRGLSHGTELAVRLPLEDEASVVTHVPAEPHANGRRRILIVEDNADGAQTLSRLLEMAGHDVRIASTGPEGLKIALESHPEFILCDIGLPELDGYHLADELRKEPSTAKTHLIAITGYGSDKDKQLSRVHGFEHHLTKPADAESLLELIRTTP
jgi:two-component system CheB/CheR fusion protein